jgi:pantetheine-phosphate adenylyltransferase
MILAVFAGSFDPPSYGHLNVIERAGRLFDRIHVVIAVNREKKYLFSTEERCEMMKELVAPFPNVSVHLWDRLIVDYAREYNAQVLLRGVRNAADFSYELELSLLNRGLNPQIETVFVPTDAKYVVIRSSAIKEVASYGGDISSMVPNLVEERLKMKFPSELCKNSLTKNV